MRRAVIGLALTALVAGGAYAAREWLAGRRWTKYQRHW